MTGRGFAADKRALDERRALARGLVGQRVVRVEYVNIDYYAWDLGYREQGVRREISGEAEWREPTWDAATFHHADFGVELTTADGECWGITWDPPGDEESLRLAPGPVSGAGAVWDVSFREPWCAAIASDITDVALRYHPWSSGAPGFWCTRVSLYFDTTRVEVLLGDRDQAGQLKPSADNVAVVLDPDALPDWERTSDLV